jgi:hypothetical protein
VVPRLGVGRLYRSSRDHRSCCLVVSTDSVARRICCQEGLTPQPCIHDRLGIVVLHPSRSRHGSYVFTPLHLAP